MVVDDQRHPPRRRVRTHRRRQREHVRREQPLRADLQNVYAARHHPPRHVRRIFGGDVAEIEDAVEPGVGEGFHGGEG